MPLLFNYKNCIQTGLWGCCLPAPQPQMPLGWTSGSLHSFQRRKYTSSCYSRLILLGERRNTESEPFVECVKYAYGETGGSRKRGNRFNKIVRTPVETARVGGLCVACALPGDKEYFCPELPYMSVPSMFLNNAYYLIYFLPSVSLNYTGNIFLFQSSFSFLSAAQGNFNIMLFCPHFKYLRKTKDLIRWVVFLTKWEPTQIPVVPVSSEISHLPDKLSAWIQQGTGWLCRTQDYNDLLIGFPVWIPIPTQQC